MLKFLNVLTSFGWGFLSALAYKLIWNIFIGPAIGWPQITYVQALGGCVLYGLITFPVMYAMGLELGKHFKSEKIKLSSTEECILSIAASIVFQIVLWITVLISMLYSLIFLPH